MIANTNEDMKKPINMEFLIFGRFQVDAKRFQMFFSMVRET
jgi:hypothetical protein